MATKTTVIDGKNLILGRLGSIVSKRLLLGENIEIINCRDVVIVGREKQILERYKNKLKNKVVKQGPIYSRNPCAIVKRALRNMLPYKSKRGAQAFKNLTCHNLLPSSLKNKPKEDIESAKANFDTLFHYTNVGKICKKLGYKEVKNE